MIVRTVFLFSVIFFHEILALESENPYEDVATSSEFCSKVLNAESYDLQCDFQGKSARLGSLNESGLLLSSSAGTGLHLSVTNASVLWITSVFQTWWRERFSSLTLTLRHVTSVTQDPAEFTSANYSSSITLTLESCSIENFLPGLITNTKTAELVIENCTIYRIGSNAFQNVEKFHQLRIKNSVISQWEGGATPTAIALSESETTIEGLPFVISSSTIQKIGPNSLCLNLDKESFFNIINSSVDAVSSAAFKFTGSGHIIITESRLQQIQDGGIQTDFKNSKTKNLKPFEKPSLTIIDTVIDTQSIDRFFQQLKVNGHRKFVRLILNATTLQQIADVSELWTNDNSQSTAVNIIGVTCPCDQLEIFQTRNDQSGFQGREEAANQEQDYYDTSSDAVSNPTPSPNLEKSISCLSQTANDTFLSLSVFYQRFCTTGPLSAITNGSSSGNNSSSPTEPAESISVALVFQHWLFYVLAAGGVAGTVGLILMGIFHVKRRERSLDLKGNTSPRQAAEGLSVVGVVGEEPIYEEEDREEEC